VSPTETLGRYPLRRLIAQGSMGFVYESVDPESGRQVAIKVLRRDLLSSPDAQRFLAWFRAEAHAAAGLVHPGIVTVYSYAEDTGCPYTVMEYVEARSLRDCLERRVAFTVAQSVEIILQILKALQYAHERGVWHRDIKPSNILVTATGQTKVADFGIARTQCGGSADELMGTPGYIAPETYLGDVFDHRIDVFAAGALLYELFTGTSPFAGTPEQAMFRTCYENPLPPSKVAGLGALQPYDAAVLHALAKRPEDRFSSAEEFGNALLQAGNQLSQAQSRDQPVSGCCS
jgi:eukaryotic-like serine/threonine-protein kinase